MKMFVVLAALAIITTLVSAGSIFVPASPTVFNAQVVGRGGVINTSDGNASFFMDSNNLTAGALSRAAFRRTRDSQGVEKFSMTISTGLVPNTLYYINWSLNTAFRIENDGCRMERQEDISICLIWNNQSRLINPRRNIWDNRTLCVQYASRLVPVCDLEARYKDFRFDFADMFESSGGAYNLTSYRVNASALIFQLLFTSNATGGVFLDPTSFSSGTVYTNSSNISAVYNELANTSAVNVTYTGGLFYYYIRANLRVNNNSDWAHNASEYLIFNESTNNAHNYICENNCTVRGGGGNYNVTANRMQLIFDQGLYGNFVWCNSNFSFTGSGAGAGNNSGGLQVYRSGAIFCNNTVHDSFKGFDIKDVAQNITLTGNIIYNTARAYQLNGNGSMKNVSITFGNVSKEIGSPASNNQQQNCINIGLGVTGVLFHNISCGFQRGDYVTLTGASDVGGSSSGSINFSEIYGDGENLGGQGAHFYNIISSPDFGGVTNITIQRNIIKNIWNGLGMDCILFSLVGSSVVKDSTCDNVRSTGVNRPGYGIRDLNGRNMNFTNNTLKNLGNNNTGTGGEAIQLSASNNTLISYSHISDTGLSNSGDAIRIDDSNYTTIFNNTFSNIDLFGIAWFGIRYINITGNVITTTNYGMTGNDYYATIQNNYVVCGGTIKIGINIGGFGHVITDNKILSCTDGFSCGMGIQISNGNNVTTARNSFSGGDNDLVSATCTNTSAQTIYMVNETGNWNADAYGDDQTCNTTTVLLNHTGAVTFGNAVCGGVSDSWLSVNKCWFPNFTVMDDLDAWVPLATINTNATFANVSQCGVNITVLTGAVGYAGLVNLTQYYATDSWNVSAGTYTAVATKYGLADTQSFILGNNTNVSFRLVHPTGAKYVQSDSIEPFLFDLIP